MSERAWNFGILMAVAVVGWQAAAAQEKVGGRLVVEKSLGPVGPVDLSKRDTSKPNYWISPDGRRYAHLIEKGIVIDGQKYQFEREVKERSFHFSPDSKRTVFVAQVGEQGETVILDGVPEKRGWNFVANHEGAVFSRDGQHVAYTARRYVGGGVEYVLVIDGKEREVFLESPAWSMFFTADGKRVVWGQDVEKRTLMRETSVDGSEPKIERRHGPALMTINAFFGGEGQMGYAAKDMDGKHFLFYDGKEGELRFKYEIKFRDVLLSTDGKHVAYVAEPESFRTVVVVDGKQSKSYGGLDASYVKDTLVLSPDGRRWAYAIKQRNNVIPVIDGKESSKPYRNVSGFTFSPDSKRLAFRAISGDKLVIVVDGQESGNYDELGRLVFSPDGKTLACGAVVGKQEFMVVNGQKQKAYGSVDLPVFSPDSKRMVYEAEIEVDGKSLLVEGTKEGKQYDDIKNQFYFSDDGRRLATVVYDGDHQMVVMDGVEGKRYDTIVTVGGAKVHFDGPDRWHYLAARGGEMFLVEETAQP